MNPTERELPPGLPPLPSGMRYAGQLKDYASTIFGRVIGKDDNEWSGLNNWNGMANATFETLTGNYHVAVPTETKVEPANRAEAMNPPETAPKDGSLFLGDFGWPQLLPTMWNSHDQKWNVALPQIQEMAPYADDNYFENEQQDPGDLKGWIEWPTKA